MTYWQRPSSPFQALSIASQRGPSPREPPPRSFVLTRLSSRRTLPASSRSRRPEGQCLYYLVQAELNRVEVLRWWQVQVFDPERPPGAPVAQAASLVAHMKVAVALTALRRRLAGDAVFLHVAAMLDSLHCNLRSRINKKPHTRRAAESGVPTIWFD